MSKKIGYFMVIMLALYAFLLLSATESRRNSHVTETKPQQSQTGTTAATDPETEPQSTEPEETEDASQDQTEPPRDQTQKPQEPQEPQEPDGPVQEPDGPVQEPEKSRVEQLLDKNKIVSTAVSTVVYDAGLNDLPGTGGQAEDANGPELARLSAKRKGNPVSAFWILQSEGLYEKRKDVAGYLDVEAFTVPKQGAKQYAYTAEGARSLITDWLMLSAGIDDELPLELTLLGDNTSVEAEQIHLSTAEGCYYGYFIAHGERSTHILCFYLRGKEGGNIQDVEFQLLNLCHATGDTVTLAQLEKRGQRQAAALMASAELLMTGSTNAGKGKIDFSRTVGGYGAKVSRYWFSADTEMGSLTNYRLKK